jgi:hypothetical protein
VRVWIDSVVIGIVVVVIIGHGRGFNCGIGYESGFSPEIESVVELMDKVD